MKSNRSKNSEKICLQYVHVNSKPIFLFLLKLWGFLFHKTLNSYTSYLRYFCVTAEHLTCVRDKVVQFSGILGRYDSQESSISSHLHQTSCFLLMNHLEVLNHSTYIKNLSNTVLFVFLHFVSFPLGKHQWPPVLLILFSPDSSCNKLLKHIQWQLKTCIYFYLS